MSIIDALQVRNITLKMFIARVVLLQKWFLNETSFAIKCRCAYLSAAVEECPGKCRQCGEYADKVDSVWNAPDLFTRL